MVKEITPGYYDDVITDGLKPDRETGVVLLFYNGTLTFFSILKLFKYINRFKKYFECL